MTAAISLACAFPPRRHLNGACTTIADISRGACREANPLFVRSEREAVRLIVRANMERATAHGHGNRAAKRALQASAAKLAQLTEHDVDVLAEEFSEARRHVPFPINPHDS